MPKENVVILRKTEPVNELLMVAIYFSLSLTPSFSLSHSLFASFFLAFFMRIFSFFLTFFGEK